MDRLYPISDPGTMGEPRVEYGGINMDDIDLAELDHLLYGPEDLRGETIFPAETVEAPAEETREVSPPEPEVSSPLNAEAILKAVEGVANTIKDMDGRMKDLENNRPRERVRRSVEPTPEAEASGKFSVTVNPPDNITIPKFTGDQRLPVETWLKIVKRAFAAVAKATLPK